MFAKIVAGSVAKYPYSFIDMRKDNPQVSFPSVPSKETFESFGAHEVFTTSKPAFNEMTHRCVEGTPVFSGTRWEQAWVVSPLSAEEIAAKQLAVDDVSAVSYAKAAPVIQYLATHTPAECEAYIQANVTDLASARNMMGKFAIALCVLARSTLR